MGLTALSYGREVHGLNARTSLFDQAHEGPLKVQAGAWYRNRRVFVDPEHIGDDGRAKLAAARRLVAG
jgi:hypothetical protein